LYNKYRAIYYTSPFFLVSEYLLYNENQQTLWSVSYVTYTLSMNRRIHPQSIWRLWMSWLSLEDGLTRWQPYWCVEQRLKFD